VNEASRENMKIKTIIFVCCTVLFQANVANSQQKIPPTSNVARSSQEIAKLALQSTVLIITEGSNGQPIGQGSGFVFAPGLVVSNLHVFERATNAIVKVAGSEKIYKAIEVVAISAKDDICVIRIENTSVPPLRLGDSDKVNTGDEIFVASNPKGLEGSFTKGIVSSIRKQAGLLQIDASISSGSSGGVLLNTKAEAIGIVRSSVVSGQNLNFAIPISKLKSLPRRFKHPIVLAGACAFSDTDKEVLKGPVMKLDTRNDTLTRVERESRVVRNYDRIGNETEEIHYSSKNVITWRVSRVFDESSLVVSQTNYYDDGTKKTTNFSFDEAVKNKLDGRQFGMKITRAEDEWEIFNDFGWLTESSVVGFQQMFKYDKDGREAEQKFLLGSKVISHSLYSYQFDGVGNWLERTERVNYDPAESEWANAGRIVREITYY